LTSAPSAKSIRELTKRIEKLEEFMGKVINENANLKARLAEERANKSPQYSQVDNSGGSWIENAR
jgi:hypothetical protein